MLNDTNRLVVNFYNVLKSNFKKLESLIQVTLHSRAYYADAWVMYNNPHLFTDVQLAWAFWMLCNQSFNSSITSTWSCSKHLNKCPKKNANKKRAFTDELSARMEAIQLECIDALKVIDVYDSEQTLFYVDPPYYNANMGHYGGYKQSDFVNLLEALSNIKGKFILSSYPSDVLSDYIEKNGWKSESYDMHLAASKSGKRKTEVITRNF